MKEVTSMRSDSYQPARCNKCELALVNERKENCAQVPPNDSAGRHVSGIVNSVVVVVMTQEPARVYEMLYNHCTRSCT